MVPSRYSSMIMCVLVSCSLGGGGERPPAAGTTRTFDVDFTQAYGPVKDFSGLDGDVARTSMAEPGWAFEYQQRGIGLARIPRGSGCGFTLDAVCPNPAGSSDTVPLCTYSYNTLDRQVKDLFQMGMRVVWQAMFDVGAGACLKADGVETATRTVQDPEVWPSVVSSVVKHLRSLGMTPHMVEFLPDATGTGGYDDNQTIQLMNLYDSFIDRLREDFPADDAGSRPFAVAAPSLGVGAFDDIEKPDASLGAFVDHVSAQPARYPDLVSVITTAASPQERLDMWKAARKRLDTAGMFEVGLAEMGPLVPDDVWEQSAGWLATRRDRSAFVAARLTAARILGQYVLDEFVADRRSGPRASPDSAAGEDLFVDVDGTPLPAFTAAMPFYLMRQKKASLLKVVPRPGEGQEDPGGLYVMAVRSGGDGVQVLVAAPGEGSGGGSLTYQLEVTGLPGWAGSAELARAVVDRNTTAFAFVEKSSVSIDGGSAFVSRDIDVPSVHYIDLELVETPVGQPDAWESDVVDSDAKGEGE